MVQSDQGMEDISLKPGCLTQGLHDPQNASATLWHVCAHSIPIVCSRTRDPERGRRVRANTVPGESRCCVSRVPQGTVTPQEARTGMRVSKRGALRLWI